MRKLFPFFLAVSKLLKMKRFLAASVWINVNPNFERFDGRVIRYLSKRVPIAYGEYSQQLDEASSTDIGSTSPDEYFKSKHETADIIGVTICS